MQQRSFVIIKDHLKLARRIFIGWNDVEFGAPEIDPKRPYGNSSVLLDIAEILGEDPTGEEEDDPLTVEQEERLTKLHEEMQIVLQIALCTGKFETGTYAKSDKYNSLSWKKLKIEEIEV